MNNAIQAITAAANLQALCDALNAYRPEVNCRIGS